MRIGVLSDTHNNLYLLDMAVKRMGKIDMLIHLGDNYSDAIKANEIYKLPLEYVVGNNDYDYDPVYFKVLNINGKRILITHGHKYRIYYDLNTLYYKALEERADLVLYGHTHRQNIEWVGNILFVNPGSTSLPRGGKPGAAVINIDDKGSFSVDMINLVG